MRGYELRVEIDGGSHGTTQPDLTARLHWLSDMVINKLAKTTKTREMRMKW